MHNSQHTTQDLQSMKQILTDQCVKVPQKIRTALAQEAQCFIRQLYKSKSENVQRDETVGERFEENKILRPLWHGVRPHLPRH